MKKNFDKLPYGQLIEDLKISSRNKDLIDKFLKDRKGYVTESRLIKYRHALTRFAYLVEKDLDKLTYDEVREAGGIINQSNLSVRTKQDVITEVKTAFKFWFGKNQFFPEAVAGLKTLKTKGKIKLPEEMPSEKEIYSMIKACNNSRDKFFIALVGLDSALRPIEARNIKWGDLKKDKYGHFITIRTAKKSGDKDTRTIRIIKSEPYFIKWNQDYPAEKKDDAFVFVNYSDLKQMNQGTISALFNRLKKKLGMKVLYPYLLRHQWITRASKNPEWSIPLLKKFVGHSLASNTIAEYQHFGDDDLKDIQLKVNGVIKDKEKRIEERKPRVCPKCKKPNEYDAEFCSFCNMALSQKRQVEFMDLIEQNNKLMFELLQKKIKEQLSKSG